MRQLAFSITVVGLLVLLFFPVRKSHAANILYEATDLTDTVPAEDLWQYSYTVSEYTFNTDYGFTIYFDYQLYSHLEDPPPSVNADWDPIVLQPDTTLPDDGAYDALAVADGASLADPFILSFVWLGSSIPGSQPFEVYRYDFDSDTIEILDSGQTALVPEPAAMLLLGSGLAGMAVLRKRKNRSRT